MNGHFDPERFTLDDIQRAVHATHDLPIPAPPNMSVATINEAVANIKEANPERAEYEQFGSAVAWGIAIGVIAERNRLERINQR